MDALDLLREFTSQGKAVVLEGDKLKFGDLEYDKDIETKFKSINGHYYTLAGVWFMLQHKAEKYTEYLKQCSRYKYPSVSLVDKQELISYLTGKTKTSQNISAPSGLGINSASTRPESLQSAGQKRPRPADKNESAQETKRRKTGDNGDADADSMDIAQPDTDLPDTATNSTPIEGGDSDLSSGLEHILKRERVLRTRTSALETDAKEFNDVITYIKEWYKKEKREQRRQAQQMAAASYDRYNRKEQEHWKSKGNFVPEQFQIDTRGSFATAGLTLKTPGSNPTATHSTPSSKAGSSRRTAPRSSSSSHSRQPTPSNSRKSMRMPIIIVPPVANAPLSLRNIKSFLEKGTYVHTGNSNSKKPTRVTFKGPNLLGGDRRTTYVAVDDVSKLTKEDWYHVVAVFVIGPAWHLRGWKWAEPVNIFTNVAGFHLTFKGTPIPPAIHKWNVKILELIKDKRYKDQTASLAFWTILKEASKKNKNLRRIFS
eukprot:TRINITY_DN5984_c0_g1_i2.p1 TRINITY_DN5984_c0_g1~~TRINITY_DN5984_c0_g1_i2.p1  ORF type:complete len:485 (+),score=71.45 TRINITY_DN5984_c0_g1_i2:3-1457(+)